MREVLSPEARDLLDAVRDRIAADVHEGIEVVVVECPHRGFAGRSYDGNGRSDGDMIVGGPWRDTAHKALEELADEWARGCE